MIYARQNGALNGSAMFVFDIAEAAGKWSLLSADEACFATPKFGGQAGHIIAIDECDVEGNMVSEPVAESDPAPYDFLADMEDITGDLFDGISDAAICNRASEIKEKMYKRGDVFTSPQLISRYLRGRLEHLESEQFHGVFLDSQHRLIKTVVLAYGTIDGAAVYPREVVKEALACNAAAVIFAHNHPSGIATASEADKNITARLVKALSLFDIRTLDHLIIGGSEFTSFAEKGWL